MSKKSLKIVPDTVVPRKRGRPKGSKNKETKPKKRRSRKRHHGRTNFNLLQYALKKYNKEKGIKLGTKFNTIASVIWKDVPFDEHKLKIDYFDKYIHSYYAKVSRAEIEKNIRLYPDNIEFWYAVDYFGPPDFEAEDNIIFDFQDSFDSWSFEGSYNEFRDWFRKTSGLYQHLRKTYDYATFVIIDTDNESYVKYTLDIQMSGQVLQKVEEKKEVLEAKLPPEEAVVHMSSQDQKEYLIEKEKIHKELEIEKTKLKLAELKDLLREGIITKEDYFRELKNI